eukprot:11901334-Heterocapsa_arctica.AAC.1
MRREEFEGEVALRMRIDDVKFLLTFFCLGDCMRMMRMRRRILNSLPFTRAALLEHCWSTFGALLKH